MDVTNIPANLHGQSGSVLEVLLVDDSPQNRAVGVALLSTLGVQPVIACNGADALKLIRERDFDLVLMDICMPVMDGLEATVEIRRFEEANRASARVPIIAYSSSELSPTILQQVGMSAALKKPSDASLMRECLQQWCGLESLARTKSRGEGDAYA